MKSFVAAFCFIALFAGAAQTANAIRANDLIEAVLEQQDQSQIVQSLTSLLGVQDKSTSDKKAYALIKYIVVPTKAKGFIEEFETAKKSAEKFEGYITYNLVKTLDDNISYYAWAAWESTEDLANYLKSDSAKELLAYTAKEDIVTLLSAVKPIV